MNSFLSTLSGSLLEIASDTLDILELLHTASMEFTVLRENGQPIGLEVHLQYLLAEQKPKIPLKKRVSNVKKWLKRAEKQLQQTVS